MHRGSDCYGLGGLLPPLGRMGPISDVVDGVLFLEASPFITARSCTSTAARSPVTVNPLARTIEYELP